MFAMYSLSQSISLRTEYAMSSTSWSSSCRKVDRSLESQASDPTAAVLRGAMVPGEDQNKHDRAAKTGQGEGASNMGQMGKENRGYADISSAIFVEGGVVMRWLIEYEKADVLVLIEAQHAKRAKHVVM
jgi:hypothetical protein